MKQKNKPFWKREDFWNEPNHYKLAPAHALAFLLLGLIGLIILMLDYLGV